MKSKFNSEMRVGMFAFIVLAIILLLTIKVSDKELFHVGSYEIQIVLDNATGINDKTPVEIAGIQVGRVKSIFLEDSRRARVTITLDNDVKLTSGATAVLRSKGFLGDTYVELIPGPVDSKALNEGDEVTYRGASGDINRVISDFGDVAKDVKAVAASLRDLISNNDHSPFYRIMKNLEHFSKTVNNLTIRNEENVDIIATNLAEFSKSLRSIANNGQGSVEASIDHIENITRKIDEGDGTIGKLINDPTTANKINDAVDNVNGLLGGLNKLGTEFGFHTEYLGKSANYKHYVHFNLMPRPDQRFLLEFVSDSTPSADRVNRSTQITAGGTTSTVVTETSTIERNRFLFSAQLAKDFYDFTIRGGVIESSGGVGLDYNKGPIGLRFSAFDFDGFQGRKPHLKAWGDVNITKNIFLMGGLDDMINPSQPTDWFVGAGIRLVDDDIKSLLGLGGMLSGR